MGAALGAVVFKEGELAIGQRAKPVLTAIDVPEVEITFGAAANAAGAKAAEGRPMPGAVIEVAGVANGVRRFPALAKRPAPAGGWGGVALAAFSAQQGAQPGEPEGRHGSVGIRVSLPEIP